MDSPTVAYSGLLSQGYDFPDLVAKTGEFRYMVFGMHDYRRQFARIQYKMTSKMIANGRFWIGDCLLDRAVIRETGKTGVFPGSSGSVTPDGPSLNGKNPCFTHPIGICHWREPTGIEKLSNFRS
jgi:hypothetical protein